MNKLILELNNLTQRIAEQANCDVDEFNNLVDDNEMLEAKLSENKSKLDEARTTLDTQHEALKMLMSDKDKLIKTNNELSGNLVAVNNELKVLRHKLKVAQKDEKDWREKAKRNQKASSEKQKIIDRLKKSKTSVVEVQGVKFDKKTGYITDLNMVSAWYLHKNDKGEFLLINPTRKDFSQPDGKRVTQLSVWYTNGNGCYIEGIIIDDGNEVGWANPLDFSDDTPERTRNLANKFTPTPSKEITEIAKNWLYKVNMLQNANLKHEDIVTIK